MNPYTDISILTDYPKPLRRAAAEAALAQGILGSSRLSTPPVLPNPREIQAQSAGTNDWIYAPYCFGLERALCGAFKGLPGGFAEPTCIFLANGLCLALGIATLAGLIYILVVGV